MLQKIKNKLCNYVMENTNKEVTSIGLDPHLGAFSSEISINSDNNEFGKLGPPDEYREGAAYTSFDSLKKEPDLASFLEADKFPLPVTSDREGYHGDRHYDYWLSGLLDYLLIKQRSQEHGVEISRTSIIFDLGCASGRVLRHFSAQEKGIEIWGSDINIRHTEWIRKHLASDIKIFQSTSLPSLPLEDNYFDCVYAFSVFSHIDFLEHAWLLELKRILKPGGIAYLTTHTENTWEMMDETIPIYEALLKGRNHIQQYDVTPSFLATKPMPKEKMVFTYKTAKTYNSNVFLSSDYLKDAWGRFFEGIDIYIGGHYYQDVILLKKA